MRVLFLNHPEADFGGYFLWNGLCELLGHEQVVDFPSKFSYHGETHGYPSFYRNHDARFEGVMWKQGPNGPMGLTGPFDFARARPAGPDYGLGELREQLRAGRFDLVVCESPRATVIQSLRELRDVLPPRVVFHDGEDHTVVHLEHVREFGLRLYLKREFTPEAERVVRQAIPGCQVKPFPFSSCVEPETDGNRDIDIFCAIGATHPVRAKIVELVKALGNEGFRVDTGRYNWKEYIARLRRSKLAIAPRGFGQDTARRWEIPMTGALMVQERLSLLEEEPLQDGVHAAIYDPNGSDVEKKIRAYLASDDTRARVASQGRAYVLERHTNAARARRMLDYVKDVWG